MPTKTETLTDTQVADILRRPYSWVVRRDEGGRFSAKIAEFPGCIAEGDTEQEALSNLHEVAEEWLRASAASRFPIPEPPSEEGQSGKFLVRTSRSLHRRLVECAKSEGVSLNQFVSGVLAEAVGAHTAKTQTERWTLTMGGETATAGSFYNLLAKKLVLATGRKEPVLSIQNAVWSNQVVASNAPSTRVARSHRKVLEDA